jgi:hypothetical protein
MLDDIEFLIVVNAAVVPAERVSGRRSPKACP